jgi:replicative DNA helicase
VTQTATARSTARVSGRIPPHNLDAEESLLGAMLLSREAVAAALEARIKPEDFYKPAHGHVFEAIHVLYGQGEPVDPITVAEELRRADVLDGVGGTAALLRIQNSTPVSANASYYAKIVEDLALLRRLIAAAGEITEMAYDVPDEVGDALDRAESLVFEVAERRVTDSLRELGSILHTTLDQLEALYDRGSSLTGVPSGYLDLDELLLGFQPSNLIVVAARPGMGKTSFALGGAMHVAIETRRPVAFFSMEMSHLELTQRLLSGEARVDSTRLRRGNLTDTDWPRISQAVGRLAEAPFFIDDNPHCTVMEMRAKCRRIKAREGDLGLVVVDYLQLMSSPRRAENRQVEVAELSRGLKILARELEAPVMALSQLNRGVESRQDKRPMLGDLRESGCLTAGTRVVRADTGELVTLGALLEAGATDVPVATWDPDLGMTVGRMTHVFPSGVKPTFRLELASGRRVEASANHPFLTPDGWRRLDELCVGGVVGVPERLPVTRSALPVRLPAGDLRLLAEGLGDDVVVGEASVDLGVRRPDDALVAAGERRGWRLIGRRGHWRLAPGRRTSHDDTPAVWFRGHGLDRHRSLRALPPVVAGLADDDVRRFLAGVAVVLLPDVDGLDGLAVPNRRLAEELQVLHDRLGVPTRLQPVVRADGRPVTLLLAARPAPAAPAPAPALAGSVVPAARVAVAEPGRTLVGVGAGGGRSRAAAAAPAVVAPLAASAAAGATAAVADPFAGADLGAAARASGAAPGVRWDPVTAIRPLGRRPVFDATVPGTHCFVADGVIVHNSIEQDADVVMFIYRDEIYNTDSPDRGVAEVIVAKHRSGPTGAVRLAFLDHYTKFANMARE